MGGGGAEEELARLVVGLGELIEKPEYVDDVENGKGWMKDRDGLFVAK